MFMTPDDAIGGREREGRGLLPAAWPFRYGPSRPKPVVHEGILLTSESCRAYCPHGSQIPHAEEAVREHGPRDGRGSQSNGPRRGRPGRARIIAPASARR